LGGRCHAQFESRRELERWQREAPDCFYQDAYGKLKAISSTISTTVRQSDEEPWARPEEGRDNDVIADPSDQWMYFFRRAEGSTAKELLEWLPDPVFKRAIGVLEP
jgi:hypothetical protein